MATWTDDELNQIGNVEELQIASFRRDGGVEKDVMFVEDDEPRINEQIDAACRTKYRHSPPGVDHLNNAAAGSWLRKTG